MCIELILELVGGRPGILFLSFFVIFFSTCEKITQFLEFCKDQGGKIQVKPFGLKLQSSTFLIGPSEKSGIEIKSGY